MEIDQIDFFYINKIRNVKISNEMQAIVDAKIQASIE